MQKLFLFHHNRRINRADLLHGLLVAGDAGLKEVACLAGYAAPQRPFEFRPQQLPDNNANEQEDLSPDAGSPGSAEPRQSSHYYRVLERQSSDLMPDSGSGESGPPTWYDKIPELDLATVAAPELAPPDKEPLVSWARLWPVLQALLSENRRSRQIDMPRLIKTLARGEIPHTFPRQQRQQWSANVQLLVDRPARTELFDDDYNELLSRLLRLRGETGVVVQEVLQQPGKYVRIRQGEQYKTRPWHLPEAGATILILSDLGLLDRSECSLYNWLKFGKRLQTAGFNPIVLLPLPPRYLRPEVVAVFRCVSWTRHSTLKSIPWVAANVQRNHRLSSDQEAGASDLLAWLSPAVRVEPALLRAVRHLLPPRYFDSGTEVAAWLHPDVATENLGFYIKPSKMTAYRQQFKVLAKQRPELAARVVRVLRDAHRHIFPTHRHDEMLALAELMGDQLDLAYGPEVEAARLHFKQLLRALREQVPGSAGLMGYTHTLLKRQHPQLWQHQAGMHLPALYGVLRSRVGMESQRLPDALGRSPEAMRIFLQFFEQEWQEAREYVLYQHGDQKLQLSSRYYYETGMGDFAEGSPLATLTVNSQFALNQRELVDGQQEALLLPLDDESVTDCSLLEQEQQRLFIGGEQLTIERFHKPVWASAIWYHRGAPVLSTGARKQRKQWYWYPATLNNDEQPLRGFWYSSADLSPVPGWGEALQRDQYGLYADVYIPTAQAHTSEYIPLFQRFRWIEPTAFLMGSPEGEEGRFDEREAQHEVTLTQGYWLADTVCTQQLWQAVMSDNPSHFKGEENPVDTVSWEDIQEFLQRLNAYNPELSLRLPTEAEWENACRAGTETPFHFGGKADLTLDKVNYSGEWEGFDHNGQTQPVKHYPPNQWGLYEMHGNVLEWCRDWYGDYPAEPVVDPVGPESGNNRVLRGGSWLFDGRYCRSAYRYDDDPSSGNVSTGFRLARGSVAVGFGMAGQQRTGGMRPGGASSKSGAERLVQKVQTSTEPEVKGILGRLRDRLKR